MLYAFTFTVYKEGTKLEGYNTPRKNASIICNIYGAHFDEEVFPNPEKFDPTRFLNSDWTRVKSKDNMIAFGLGKKLFLD